VLSSLIRFAVLPAALGAGIVLQLAYPGDFGYRFERASPAWPTWIAAVGGVAALVAAIALARRSTRADRQGVVAAAAVALFVLPVAVHGFRHWSPLRSYGEVTPGLVHALQRHAHARDVLLSDPATGYVLAGYAPVYLVDEPLAHVADTSANRPRRRLHDAYVFFARRDLSVARRYGARWIVVDRRRHRLRLDLPRVYADRRYVLYRFG
jgi:hypothetical protein